MKASWKPEGSHEFLFDFELEGGVNDEHMFTIAFNSSPFSPAKTQGDPDDCHDAEGGEIEDLTVFINTYSGPMNEACTVHEVPEYLWSALGFDRKVLVQQCEDHVRDEDERLASQEGDRKCDEARDERLGGE